MFDKDSSVHNDLIESYLPNKITSIWERNHLIDALQNNDGYLWNPLIDYRSLVGTRVRARDQVNSIIQALIPGQSRLGIVDWACDNFIRFAYTLNFISYQESTDSFSITSSGLELSRSPDAEKFNILKIALQKYPPVIRILELLHNRYHASPENPSLTKFEIWRELGFKGEDGFTTYSQNVFIQALNSVDVEEKNKIRQNWEWSSDKYARMICGWLRHEKIGWIKSTRKSISVHLWEEIFTEEISSYQITIGGIGALRSSRSYSSHRWVVKNVSFEMLATKNEDKNYLRMRRALILKSLTQPKTLDDIVLYLTQNNFINISKETVEDDIQNFMRIGLQINCNNHRYGLIDEIELLGIPNTSELHEPTDLEGKKQVLRSTLKKLDHEFLDLLDLSRMDNQWRQFEIRIVELLNKVITAKHLSGGSRPEIVAYFPDINPVNCVIMDSKSYRNWFSIPASERDKMIRYIEEYKAKDWALNSNRWWENFQNPNYPTANIKFSFVSSLFIGQFQSQLTYIYNRTFANWSAITAEVLLVKIDRILNDEDCYGVNDFFQDIACCNLVRL